MVTVGVLALQGDFAAHGRALGRVGVATIAVRRPADLAAADALVLPGGESTAMLHGLARDGVEAPLRAFLRSGRPVLGTCAGAILLARRVTNPPQRSLDAAEPLRGLCGVFIRAPRIRRVGAGVEVLARHAGEPVLVRAGGVWAATFHPELGDDDRVLRLWLAGSADAPAVSPAAAG